MDARLATGGWRALTRQGLAPCKRRQAFLGARTPGFSCCRKRERGTSARCRQSAANPCSAQMLAQRPELPTATGQEPQRALPPAPIVLTPHRQGHACATPRQTHLNGSPVVRATISINSRCTAPQPVSSSRRYAAEKKCIVCPSASRM
jgi:hypothetical protein